MSRARIYAWLRISSATAVLLPMLLSLHNFVFCFCFPLNASSNRQRKYRGSRCRCRCRCSRSELEESPDDGIGIRGWGCDVRIAWRICCLFNNINNGRFPVCYMYILSYLENPNHPLNRRFFWIQHHVRKYRVETMIVCNRARFFDQRAEIVPLFQLDGRLEYCLVAVCPDWIMSSFVTVIVVVVDNSISI